MTIPVEYGGHGASPLDRYVVTEELLAAGAPVAAHWVADRQIGPSLMRFGTEEQRRRFLPGIAAGEVLLRDRDERARRRLRPGRGAHAGPSGSTAAGS